MITILIALSIWAFVLSGGNIFLAGLAIVVAIFRFRRNAYLVAIALVAVQFSMFAGSHPELKNTAQQFASHSVVLEALADGQAMTKVRVVEFDGCPKCIGGLGQYSGSLKTGDKLSGTLMIRPSFGYGEFVAKGRAVVTPAIPGGVSVMREAFLGSLSGISSQSKALVAGLAIGDVSLFSQEFTNELKVLSLTHLNAVSGANCAIVVAAVHALLGLLIRRRWLKISISVLSLIGYVLLVGGSASVVRAAIMAAIVLLAIERGIWPVAALSLTVSAMLIYDPNYAAEYGFALSVLATAGILIIAPALTERLSARMPAWLALALSVTLAAQLWCMPVLLGLQGGIPTYSVLANLLAEPVVAPITVLGIAAACIAFIFPPAAQVLTFVASVPAQWVVFVSGRLHGLPAATLTWHTGLIGMIVLVAGLSVWLIRSTRFGAFVMVAVLLLEAGFNLAALTRAITWLPKDWAVVNCDVGQGDALVIRSGEHVAVVDVGREPEPVNHCLTELGISKIDLLVLTHFDADHIGGLSGALAGRSVETVFLTPFDDKRPLVAVTLEKLRGVGKQVKVGYGTYGSLGEVNYEVLSPSPTAAEAEDANDGSVVMRWESPNWLLYTFADLGERGQMRLGQRLGSSLSHPSNKPVILKVTHHGSSDTYPELVEQLRPNIALISVGRGNSYGHPTKRAITMLQELGAEILRTDQQGMLAVTDSLRFAVSGGG